MINSETKKLVLFGAGKIGRSFIAQLFSLGGYEVVFIDVVKPIIDELNRRRNYNVIIKAEKEEVLNIKNVRGVLTSEEQNVINEIAGAGILGGIGFTMSLFIASLSFDTPVLVDQAEVGILGGSILSGLAGLIALYFLSTSKR